MGGSWPRRATDGRVGRRLSTAGAGRTCVYMLCGVSPKKPLAACSCKYMAWSMTVMQLLMLPISSRTVGWSVAKRHSLSTINLYWYVPAGRKSSWSAQSLWPPGPRAGHGCSGKSCGAGSVSPPLCRRLAWW